MYCLVGKVNHKLITQKVLPLLDKGELIPTISTALAGHSVLIRGTEPRSKLHGHKGTKKSTLKLTGSKW
jgi:hypothetical protein